MAPSHEFTLLTLGSLGQALWSGINPQPMNATFTWHFVTLCLCRMSHQIKPLTALTTHAMVITSYFTAWFHFRYNIGIHTTLSLVTPVCLWRKSWWQAILGQTWISIDGELLLVNYLIKYSSLAKHQLKYVFLSNVASKKRCLILICHPQMSWYPRWQLRDDWWLRKPATKRSW